ncbi:hypothetical protein BP6252_05712 [Coleophoma cylindrospora]|uniref:F-box domain-containing protein n=1 Tax=Coleophoma cylindrospora TaxID=1849047 RepID=A0A3D8RUC2_9HELO|nr:hypothetical protein BP6252_05712 [Coleophoma cylindrospora]
MALTHLPPEILARIVEETMPEGIESFAVTCQAVYNSCQKFLAKHRRLRRLYHAFRYHGDGSLSDESACASSFQLLLRIANEPLIARYIVKADLKRDAVPEDAEIVKAHIRQMTNSGDFLSLLKDSPYLETAGVSPSSVVQYLISQYTVEDGDAGLAVTLLLTLLHNVTELTLPTSWSQLGDGPRNTLEGGNPLKKAPLLDAIIKRINDPQQRNASLSKLTTILPHTAWGYENREELTSFAPFLSIPSMRNFSAGSCIAVEDGYTGIPFPKPEQETFGVGMEKIDLTGFCVDPDELRTFLLPMSRLRVFRMSYETKWHGCGHDWDAANTFNTIHELVGNTLEEFSFSALNCFGEVTAGITSMEKFTQLKDFEVDIKLLTGYGDDLSEIPRLGDLLPATIETLCLLAENFDDVTAELDHLLSKIAISRDERLPNLKKIEMRTFLASEEDGSETSSTSEIQSRLPASNQNWKQDLEALKPSTIVRFVRTNDETLPRFTSNFRTRYSVSSY